MRISNTAVMLRAPAATAVAGWRQARANGITGGMAPAHQAGRASFAANPPASVAEGLPPPAVANERNRIGRGENEVRVLTEAVFVRWRINARTQRPALPRHGPLLYGMPRPQMGVLGFNFTIDDDMGLSNVPHSNGKRPACASASS
ncbi:hypothetical protein [Streptomyces viridochromogenes]|uniref:hypothetical protein n=1 Tax=Streptomyces viridochromogenes TaxID=1938 RepID=UPI00131B1B20|nr:hypothetical protein [Streptomyces viridochromogenes]